MSLMQYCAGGRIRWVEQGFRIAAAFKAADRKGKELFDKKGAEQWETGVTGEGHKTQSVFWRRLSRVELNRTS